MLPFFKTILQSIETKGWVDIETTITNCWKLAWIALVVIIQSVSWMNNLHSFKKINWIPPYNRNRQCKEWPSKCNNWLLWSCWFLNRRKKKALDNIGLDISSLADVEYNYGERDKLIPKRIVLLSFNYTKQLRCMVTLILPTIIFMAN